MSDLKIVFIGEERSETAKRMKVRWEDGRLAAKQLFDAFEVCGWSPAQCVFFNLFERGAGKKLAAHQAAGRPMIAMGQKVQRQLTKRGVKFVPMVHPAARGAVRRKDRYAQEVQSALNMTLRLIEGGYFRPTA
jgi:hypothetical protein